MNAGSRIAIVGTAGHVDHGKSTLVRALTGTEPDRLAEEQARGLTIDLGFAWCGLPSGAIASFVDVPGHEDFIRNMLAGAGGVQVALLVVAADEGPMPQTREHLAILDLLRVQRGVVALTKTDVVTDSEWLDLVAAAVRDMLSPTGLRDAAIVPVSAPTGAGLDTLRAALAAAIADSLPPHDRGRGRLPVDRAFTLPGFGTVVTGALRDGSFRIGDSVVLARSGRDARIRGLQVHGRAVQEAAAGTRVAVNLAGVDIDAVHRGDWLAHERLPLSKMVDIELEVLAESPTALEHDAALQVHHGAGFFPARLRLLGIPRLEPGAAGFGQLVVAPPQPLPAGDRFVLRRPSPGATVGGGRVLHAAPGRRWPRFRDATVERFAALAAGDADARTWHALALAGPAPAGRISTWDSGVEVAERDAALARLAATGRVVERRGTWYTDAQWSVLGARGQSVLRRYHERYPLRAGMPREELRSRLRLTSEAYAGWLAAAAEAGLLVAGDDTVRGPDHVPTLPPALSAAADTVLAAFRAAPFQPPSLADARERLGAEAVGFLLQQGTLVAVAPDVAFDAGAYARIREAIDDRLATTGEITLADLRDALGTSRKYAQAILEFTDRERITRRVGDARVAGVARKSAVPT